MLKREPRQSLHAALKRTENTRQFRVSVSKTVLVPEVPDERSSVTTAEEQKEQKARAQFGPCWVEFHLKKMNSADHRHALSGMASSTGIATGKKSVDSLGVRPIVERVKDRSAEFLCFRAQWVLQ